MTGVPSPLVTLGYAVDAVESVRRVVSLVTLAPCTEAVLRAAVLLNAKTFGETNAVAVSSSALERRFAAVLRGTDSEFGVDLFAAMLTAAGLPSACSVVSEAASEAQARSSPSPGRCDRSAFAMRRAAARRV